MRMLYARQVECDAVDAEEAQRLLVLAGAQAAGGAAREVVGTAGGGEGTAGLEAAAVGQGLTLRHPFQLVPASGFHEFTNYVQGFHGCLDYIWADQRGLRGVRNLSMPPETAVAEHTALPSPQFPSDHLLVAADLTFLPL